MIPLRSRTAIIVVNEEYLIKDRQEGLNEIMRLHKEIIITENGYIRDIKLSDMLLILAQMIANNGGQ